MNSSAPPGALHRLVAASMLGLLGLFTIACRGGLDSPCRCNTDCRSGLICQAEGEKSLMANMCFNLGVNGLCVEGDVLDSDSGMPSELSEPVIWDDVPSRRDFQPGGSDSLSAGTGDTGPTTSDTTTTTTTGTTTTGDTSTSTSTSTGTTGDSSTGTTTGTTGDTSTTSSTTTGGSTGSTSSTGTTSGESSSTGP